MKEKEEEEIDFDIFIELIFILLKIFIGPALFLLGLYWLMLIDTDKLSTMEIVKQMAVYLTIAFGGIRLFPFNIRHY